MGVEDDAFFLSQGGFVPGFTRFGETFFRPATGRPPTDLELPPLPVLKTAARAANLLPEPSTAVH